MIDKELAKSYVRSKSIGLRGAIMAGATAVHNKKEEERAETEEFYLKLATDFWNQIRDRMIDDAYDGKTVTFAQFLNVHPERTDYAINFVKEKLSEERFLFNLYEFNGRYNLRIELFGVKND